MSLGHQFSSFLRFLLNTQDRFIPEELKDPEDLRLAKLLIGFSCIGGAFSVLFAYYYLAIGHYNGAFVILLTSIIFVSLPLTCVKRGKEDAGAVIFVFSLIVMFSWLSAIEGGVKGHAVAWLAIMPFCSQLLVMNRKQIIGINVVTILLIAFFSGEEIWGLSFPFTYPEHHHGSVTLVGYTGLGLFMFTLGAIGEFFRKDLVKRRDQAENELKEAVEELTRLNLEKNEFLGIAAHDLNNPLSVISGYAEMIQYSDDLSKEEINAFSQEIFENSSRMSKIVQDVLDVNRIESGQYPVNRSPVGLRDLFESCLKPYRDAVEQKELKLETELADLRVTTDAHALSQILDNLISNAVKYASQAGKIRVSLYSAGEGFVFEVFNEGRGFTEEDKEKLFSRFAKLSTRPTAGEGSVGLGLSITHKIIEALGGRIVCESELHQGALFRVTFPERGHAG